MSQSSRTGETTTTEALDLKEYKYWSMDPDEVIDRLHTSANGLTKIEASRRLASYGRNVSAKGVVLSSAHLILSQFKSPLVLIFIAAAILSFFLEDPHDAIVIIVILFISVVLGFWQERDASNTVKRLLSMLKTRSVVLREEKEEEILAEEIVPGDILVLRAGDKVPCDCLLLESKDLFVDESFLTGESYPVEKSRGKVQLADSPVRQRENSVFMGSYVISGEAKVIAVRTGRETEFSEISSRLKTSKPETDFQKGIRHFGYLLAEITLVLIIANFALNVYLQRPVLDSFLFSLALAIGLTPQLLPAIVSVNIAHGARRMAAKKVIVKRLDSIENLGSMNVLCSDKTGTLTVGSMELHSAIDTSGIENARVFLYAYLNAVNETGFVNPIDQAIVKAGKKNGLDISAYAKLDEIPYDFARKRLTILVSKNGSLLKEKEQSLHTQNLMITKGAFYNILEICSMAETSDGQIVALGPDILDKLRNIFEEMSRKGFRVLGLCYKVMDSSAERLTRENENSCTFVGFIILGDPIRPGVNKSIHNLERVGISLKMISGDNRLIASHVSEMVGMSGSKLLVGLEVDRLTSDALVKRVNEVDVFAEIEPRQKERIILALKKQEMLWDIW